MVMGEAKRKQRAERRREALMLMPAPKVDPERMFVEVKFLVPRRIANQIAARHNFVKEHYPVRSAFDAALYVAGVEVFDQDIAAFQAHAEGKSKPVAPQPQPERLVIPAGEVDPAAVKTLAKLHDANVAAHA